MKYLISASLIGLFVLLSPQLFAQEIKVVDNSDHGVDQPKGEEQPQAFNFETNAWSKVLKSAKAEKRIIFVQFMANNCDACKLTRNSILTNAKIAGIYSQKFVLFSPPLESKDMAYLTSKYKINSFPTELFVDGNGAVIHKYIGFADEMEMVNMAENVASGKNTLKYFKARYKKLGKKMLPVELFGFSKVLMHAGEDTKEVVNAYFKTQDEGDLMTPENIEEIMLFTDKMDSREFKFLARNQSGVSSEQYSQNDISLKIEDVISNSLINTMMANKKINLEDTLSATLNYFEIQNREAVTSRVVMDYFDFVQPDREKFFYALNTYMVLHLQMLDLGTIAEKAQRVADECKDQEVILNTMNWVSESINMAKVVNVDLYEAYIDLLIKDGRGQEAHDQVNMLIDGLRATGISDEEANVIFDNLIKKIDNNQDEPNQDESNQEGREIELK